ncbi:hypothetical protein ACIQXD_06270 [Streptomyces uncialis]|uniref:hypothetical protein n=1 Tax=Streptomyces uncialis TaxID=1048205 RepID=UPI0037F9D610
MLIGPLVFLILAGVVVMFDPLLVMGRTEDDTDRRSAPVQPSLFGAPGGAPPGHHPRQTPPDW